MKHYVWTIFICMFLCMLLVLTGCTDHPAYNNTQHTVPTEKLILVYKLSCDQYLKFIESPSIQY